MIIFDEEQYSKKMIKKGFMTTHKHAYELFVLSKYYFKIGKNAQEVKNLVVEFCEKNEPYFNMDEWYKIINKTLLYASDAKFVSNKEVHLTALELDTISSLEKLNEQKVAFVMLVLHKFYDYKKFEVSIEDLYRLCKLNINSKTKLELLQSLTSKELIDITMGSKRWVKFADKKGKPVITIKNYDDFIFEYLKYIGLEGYSNCSICGKAIKQTNNRKIYCGECWKDKEKELRKEINKKYYQKNKIKTF